MPVAEAKEMWCQTRKRSHGQIRLGALIYTMHVPWRDVMQCQPWCCPSPGRGQLLTILRGDNIA